VANVTFSGKLSAQAATGEQVTVAVTKPDGTKDTLTAATDTTGAFTVTQPYTVAGSYSAVASVLADAQNSSAQSPAVAFTITVANRTVTLNVSRA